MQTNRNVGTEPANDFDFDDAHPVGTLTGTDGKVFAVVKLGGEIRVPIDIDGARYWVITARDEHPGADIAEVVRRVRMAQANARVANEGKAPGLDGGNDLVRALADLVGTMRQAVSVAVSTPAQPQTGGLAGPYSTANLPPGTTARAFSDAVRKKRVRVAVVSGRNMVLATDWDHYIASCVKKAKPVRTNATDDELLASVGSREGGRK